MRILKDISLHIGRKRLMFYVQNSLWYMCATYRRGKCSMTFYLLHRCRFMLWEKRVFIYNNYFVKKIDVGVVTGGNLAKCLAKKSVILRITSCTGMPIHALLHSQRVSEQQVPRPWLRDEGRRGNCKYAMLPMSARPFSMLREERSLCFSKQRHVVCCRKALPHIFLNKESDL